MEHVMKRANWNKRNMTHKEEGPDSVLGEEQFEISTVTE